MPMHSVRVLDLDAIVRIERSRSVSSDHGSIAHEDQAVVIGVQAGQGLDAAGRMASGA
jgi:hypothetical protein